MLRRSDLVRLKAALLRIPHVVVTDVPVVVTHEGVRGVDGKPLIPHRTVALVFLSSVNDLTIRAVNYAQSLDASVTRAIYFDLDPEAAHKLETAVVRRRARDPAGHRGGAVPRPDRADARGGAALLVAIPAPWST